MDWEVVAVLLPIAVAIWLDRRRERLTKEQIAEQVGLAREQTRAEADERAKQQRATLTVRQGTRQRNRSHSDYEFIFKNVGPAAASYITFVLVLEETSEEVSPRQSLRDLMPGEDDKAVVHLPAEFVDNPRSTLVRVAWTDLTGTHEERKGSPMAF